MKKVYLLFFVVTVCFIVFVAPVCACSNCEPILREVAPPVVVAPAPQLVARITEESIYFELESRHVSAGFGGGYVQPYYGSPMQYGDVRPLWPGNTVFPPDYHWRRQQREAEQQRRDYYRYRRHW